MASTTNGANGHTKYQQLTQSDINHFMQHGWLKLEQCFTRQQAEDITANIWTRLGMDPNDKSTWHTERTNMPDHGEMRVSEFAPKAWAAICDMVGGAERIPEWTHYWKDSFIGKSASITLNREVSMLWSTVMLTYRRSSESRYARRRRKGD